MSIAILGAGLAGLSCARALAERGIAVRLFDKGRGVGGRLATRRLEAAGRTIAIDHGAQYLEPRDPAFAGLLAGLPCASWPEAGQLIPLPTISALPRALAAGLDCRNGVTITALAEAPGGWMLADAAGERHGPFRAVVLTAPAPQSAALLAPIAPDLAEQLGAVVYAPCWSWLAAFAEPLPLPDLLRGRGPIAWAARNGAKPGRDAAEAWVVQADADWSRRHLDEPAEQVAAQLSALLPAPPPLAQTAHRWRYALVERPLGRDFLWDARRGIGLAGDFCPGGGAEAAFLSGRALAQAIAG
ncbi:MAG: NAD(P)-binding protein [Rhodovarius sp.]|nr:NAD(P)-binding protein [Rhodovarius sp.]